MNLKKTYTQTKRKNAISNIVAKALGGCIALAVLLGGGFLLNLLWNYVAIPWGLPQLKFLQFLGTIVLVRLILGIYVGFPVIDGIKKK